MSLIHRSRPAPPVTMSYLNTYQRTPAGFAPDVQLTTPPESYDYNFVFPAKLLSSDRVELASPSSKSCLGGDGSRADEPLDHGKA
jgi:hypothetical protein